MSRPPYFCMPNDLPMRLAHTMPMDAAMLNVTAWAYASQWVNDGIIPLAELRDLPGWTPKRQAHLIKTGTWEATGDAVILVEYLAVNRTREAIDNDRAQRSAAGQRGGAERALKACRDPATHQFMRAVPDGKPDDRLAPSTSTSTSTSTPVKETSTFRGGAEGLPHPAKRDLPFREPDGHCVVCRWPASDADPATRRTPDGIAHDSCLEAVRAGAVLGAAPGIDP